MYRLDLHATLMQYSKEFNVHWMKDDDFTDQFSQLLDVQLNSFCRLLQLSSLDLQHRRLVSPAAELSLRSKHDSTTLQWIRDGKKRKKNKTPETVKQYLNLQTFFIHTERKTKNHIHLTYVHERLTYTRWPFLPLFHQAISGIASWLVLVLSEFCCNVRRSSLKVREYKQKRHWTREECWRPRTKTF